MTERNARIDNGREETMETMRHSRRARTPRRAGLGLALAALLAAGGCDYFDVTNPGNLQDTELDNPAAHMAVVMGSARMLADAVNNVAYTTGAITREIFPAGSTGSFGITPRQQQGILAYDDDHVGWFSHQRARYIAESGYDRFTKNVTELASADSAGRYMPSALAALYAGYANRLLGENWCEATIDGGPIVASADVLRRAEGWFDKAIAIASSIRGSDRSTSELARATRIVQAGHAGRAAVRVGLGDWTGAVADADAALALSGDFDFRIEYNDLETAQYNRLFWAGAGTPYRAHTAWRTVYEQYYTDTGDPRVPWVDTGKTGDAAVMDLGKVPHYQQQKYPERGADIRLSSAAEMRLIRAEALLRGGDWTDAMAIINDLRAEVGMDPWIATSEAEAWTHLKRERGIELWLEGRRMHDLRRWAAANTPGALDPLELPGDASRLSTQQTLCYSIPKNERETNPNVPLTP